MDICYSNTDIYKKLDGKCDVKLYRELDKCNTLDDALGPNNAIVLLYEQKNNFGHWCCVFRNNNIVFFFDPYGVWPDDQLDEIDKKYRLKSGQAYRQLSFLMAESPYQIDYNNHQLQSDHENINTCGRWCVARLKNRFLNSDQFYKLFGPGHENIDPDELVTEYTENL
jgi:hypothetical protein